MDYDNIDRDAWEQERQWEKHLYVTRWHLHRNLDRFLKRASREGERRYKTAIEALEYAMMAIDPFLPRPPLPDRWGTPVSETTVRASPAEDRVCRGVRKRG